ncbi:MAG: Inward rectifier potassium channel Irk [Sphingobacteriales bacterium]|nr:Inward rectifier potassium channel Irk [Sphingobacteriales bacterium]
MALIKRFRNLKSEENTGYSAKTTDSAGRFYSRTTQTANVTKKGLGFFNRLSWYHTLLGMKTGKFLLLIFLGYVMINMFFAGIYYIIGIENLGGVITGSPLKNFSEVFFFSAQTFTTVGYGRIHPTGFAANAVATFEAFIGLLSFALATGLFYGRFSRPRAFVRFSHNALIAPYKDGTALMFRMAPYKNNNLSDLKADVMIAMQVDENGSMRNKFYDLTLEFDTLNSLALSWTIVHPVTEDSPLYGLSESDLKNTKLEVLVFLKAFDEVFSNTVMTRYSYVTNEIVWGAKFNMMFYPDTDKSKTILDLAKLNDYSPAELPISAMAAAN